MPTPLQIPLDSSFAFSVDVRRTTLHQIQHDIRREMRKAAVRALGTILIQVERALVAERVRCQACGGSMRSRGASARRIVTVFGPVTVRRSRYHCTKCPAVRRPLDEWLGFLAGTECTDLVREQALYLAADLPYERAAEVLRRVGGIGLSGRQIQRLLEAEADWIDAALGDARKARTSGLGDRFRRIRKGGETAGARRVLQLKRLRTSGLWDAYWGRRVRAAPLPAPTPHRPAGSQPTTRRTARGR